MASNTKNRKQRGVPWLQELVRAAQGSSDQASHVRRFLLSFYDPGQWPLDMSRLRVLDPRLQDAVLAVLELDWCGTEIHEYIEDGQAVWCEFWRMEQN